MPMRDLLAGRVQRGDLYRPAKTRPASLAETAGGDRLAALADRDGLRGG